MPSARSSQSFQVTTILKSSRCTTSSLNLAYELFTVHTSHSLSQRAHAGLASEPGWCMDECLKGYRRSSKGCTGRPSIAAEKLPRALVLQALSTVRSERMLMEQLDYAAQHAMARRRSLPKSSSAICRCDWRRFHSPQSARAASIEPWMLG
jgi:hypothetical protein